MYLPPQKIALAENRFLQAGKGTENTKEKSRQCFTVACFPRLLENYISVILTACPFIVLTKLHRREFIIRFCAAAKTIKLKLPLWTSFQP
jgi:hypothetical protein